MEDEVTLLKPPLILATLLRLLISLMPLGPAFVSFTRLEPLLIHLRCSNLYQSLAMYK